ncbi:hypothetical protein DPMN_113149 [Dreissena polymorpha]|uniref:Uncharacterized protein n=1 Tax=Dreissena polymorpha TaxID=45954 RepID=A0A9D4QQF3_DREPO|nr:hypothetical protein DPMN_113149 [Dreissena polymorpha]
MTRRQRLCQRSSTPFWRLCPRIANRKRRLWESSGARPLSDSAGVRRLTFSMSLRRSRVVIKLAI